MRALAKAVLGGVIAFGVTSIGTVVVSAQLSHWQEVPQLAPLSPTSPITQVVPVTMATTQAELTITGSEDDARAILVTPRQGAESGVVLIAGAGGADRHTLLPLAKRFAASGIAALTYDKRTDGYSLTHRDYDQLADDALAAAKAMRDVTGIDHIGAWGISEGGWVLTSAASRASNDLAFAVFAAAPVVTPLEQTRWITDRALHSYPELIRRAGATIVEQGTVLFDYLEFDGSSRMASIRVPVMALWGAEDDVVPVNEAYRRMDADLGGELRAQILPELGHDLVAKAGAWVPAAAAWMKDPSGEGLSGVNPKSAFGISPSPGDAWFTDPRLHLALSAVVGAAVSVIIWRRARHRDKWRNR